MRVSLIPILVSMLSGAVYALPYYQDPSTATQRDPNANSDSGGSMAGVGLITGGGLALAAGGLYANHRNGKAAALADQQTASGRTATSPPDFAPERPGGSAQQYYDNHPLAGATSNKDNVNAPGSDSTKVTAPTGDNSHEKTPQDTPSRAQQYTPDPEMNRYNQYTSSSHGSGPGVYNLDMPDAKSYVPYSNSVEPPRYSAPPPYPGAHTSDSLKMSQPFSHAPATPPYPDMHAPGSVSMPSVQNSELVQPKPERPWLKNTASSFEDTVQDKPAQRVASVAPQLPEMHPSTPLSMNMAAGTSDDLLTRVGNVVASGSKATLNAVTK